VSSGLEALVMRRGGAYVLSIAHDDGCTTLVTQSMRDCTCAEVEQSLEDVSTPERLQAYLDRTNR
jgi:hypothetical protein